jgi:hypothetical protein
MDSKQQALVDKFEAKREQTEARMQLLKARAKEAGADQRVKLNRRIEELEAHGESAQSRLKELRNASGEAWRDLAEGAEKAWQSFSEAVERAAQRF